MKSSTRLGTIFAIVLVAFGATSALAESPCCAEVSGFQCREADSSVELLLGRAATGCWEGGGGVCIGGSPLQSCVCLGQACFARYWSDSMRGIQPVYIPVSAEECTVAAKEGCCNPGRYFMGNCFPQSRK